MSGYLFPEELRRRWAHYDNDAGYQVLRDLVCSIAPQAEGHSVLEGFANADEAGRALMVEKRNAWIRRQDEAVPGSRFWLVDPNDADFRRQTQALALAYNKTQENGGYFCAIIRELFGTNAQLSAHLIRKFEDGGGNLVSFLNALWPPYRAQMLLRLRTEYDGSPSAK